MRTEQVLSYISNQTGCKHSQATYVRGGCSGATSPLFRRSTIPTRNRVRFRV